VRKTTWLIALMAIVALLVTSLPAGAADSGAGMHCVRVPAEAVARFNRLGLHPRLALDYGSFYWFELSEADLATLSTSGLPFIPVPEAGTIQITGFLFDPLVDGEPVLPAEMQATGRGPGLRLVQLVGPARAEWLAQLQAAGLPLLQYYPHHSYLTWATAAQAEAAEALDFVRWQGAVHPGYKINRDLAGLSGRISNVDIMFYNDGNPQATLQAIARLGGRILQFYPSQPDRAFFDAIVELDASAVTDVARINTVLWLGYSSPEPGLDDEMSSQIVAGNYTNGVPFTGYWTWLNNLGYNGDDVIWAIVDTGVDYQHPDLGPHIVGGYDFPGACTEAGHPGTDCPDGGHGTHVAGIVGGDATAGYTDANGFYYGLGVAPLYHIFAMNSLSAPYWPPSGGWQEHSKRAVLGGAIGGNNSWTTGEGTNHGYQSSERTHDFMVRDGNFDTPGVAEPFIEVFSAGNSGPGQHTLTAPKEAKNLIVVASSRNYRVGSIDSISSFSSRGPAQDGRWVPTIAAPGEKIASSRNDTGGSCTGSGYDIPGTGNLYSYCSGTSMAAPHASGSIVLITDWWRDLNGGADPSPAMAKALLVNGAVDMNEGNAIPNVHEGWGRIHLTNVLDNGVAMIYRDQLDIFDNTGESWGMSVHIPDPGKPFKVTVAWSDAPGAVGANPALVNNLDLIVSHNGNTYYGNHFSGGWSTPGGAPDTLNNLENVYIQNPGDSATITVQATNLPGDGIPFSGDTTDQDFALVCYNCIVQADFTLSAEPTSLDLCIPDEAVYTVTVDTILGFSEPITFHPVGEPTGTTVQFNPNPLTPPGTTVLILGNTGMAAPGSYAIEIVGVAPTVTHTVTVGLNLSISPTVDLSSDSPVELGHGMHFTATATGTPPPAYTWDFGGPGYGVGLTGPTPVYTYTQPGIYTATVTVENGCGRNRAVQIVEVLCYEPAVEVTSDSPALPGEPVAFTATVTGTPPFAYTWDFGGPGYGVGLTGPTPVYTYTGPGDFTVVVTAENGCGSDQAWTAVTVTPPCTEVTGVILTLVTTGTVYPGDQVVFSADLTPDDFTPPYSYTLNVGPVMTSTADPLVFTLTFTAPGTYPIGIAVWNCAMTKAVTSTVEVGVEEPPQRFHYIYLPIVIKEPAP